MDSANLALRCAGLWILALLLAPSDRALAEAGNSLSVGVPLEIVTVPHHPALNFAYPSAGTVELWIKPDQSTPDIHVIGKRSGCTNVTDFYQVVYVGSDLAAGQADCSAVANSALVLEEWIHLAYTLDPGVGVAIYINGEFVDSSPCGAWTTDSSSPLIFGTSGACNETGALIGEIDEVRFWDYARDPSDIKHCFDKQVDPRTPGLIGYWNFDETLTDQIVHDISGNGHDGFLGVSSDIDLYDASRVPSTAPIDEWCDPVTTEESSWGAVKILFKDH